MEVFLATMSKRCMARQAHVEAERRKNLDAEIEKLDHEYNERERMRIERAAQKLAEAQLQEQSRKGKRKSKAKNN